MKRVGSFLQACSLTLAAAGCASDPPVEPPVVTPPATQACPEDRTCDFVMELGIGVYEFGELLPGDLVPVTLGPQGGYHIWLATRCRDCARQVLIEYGVRSSSDHVWLLGQPLRGIVNQVEEDGWQTTVGLYGLMPGSPNTVDYVGLTFELEATIEDEDRTATRTVPIQISHVEVWDCPTSDPAECE